MMPCASGDRAQLDGAPLVVAEAAGPPGLGAEAAALGMSWREFFMRLGNGTLQFADVTD